MTGVHDLLFNTDISEQRSFRFQIANCCQAPDKAWLSRVLDMAFSEVISFEHFHLDNSPIFSLTKAQDASEDVTEHMS